MPSLVPCLDLFFLGNSGCLGRPGDAPELPKASEVTLLLLLTPCSLQCGTQGLKTTLTHPSSRDHLCASKPLAVSAEGKFLLVAELCSAERGVCEARSFPVSEEAGACDPGVGRLLSNSADSLTKSRTDRFSGLLEFPIW